MLTLTTRLIVAGPPGSGKTTLINALAERGYRVYPEVSRQLIDEQQQQGGNLLPWVDLAAFATACVERMLAQLDDADSRPADQPCFFDGGLPDIVVYLRHGGLSVPDEMFDLPRRYGSPDRLALLTPAWRDIYCNDNARPQPFEEALQIERLVLQSYRDCGFDCVALPKDSVIRRIELIEQS